MKLFLSLVFLFPLLLLNAQQDSLHHSTTDKFSFHWQLTGISQYHFDFRSPYSGNNSLQASEPAASSISATAYLAYRPSKNTYLIFNAEAAGGKGLSKTMGIAGFPNGEVYRVGDPTPKPFIARLYAEHRFPLSNRKEWVDDDQNQIAETTHKDYLSILAGKFSLTDFFDDSYSSHDQRTQFMNWSLMGNGAWDYPANTRGYTMGAVVQAFYCDWIFRTAITTVPIEANGPELQFKFGKAMGLVGEIEKTHLFKESETNFSSFRMGAFLNKARMGNYLQSIQTAGANPPDITATRQYGRSKLGLYASFDNHFGNVHHFVKGSSNDGKNETWAFTEIDNSYTTGIQWDGVIWHRKNDRFSIAYVSNALSDDHKTYLAKGGYGFLIGDGKLNYGREQIFETYYLWSISKYFFLSPDYQFVINPAYNKDRGPVHIIALRLHAEF